MKLFLFELYKILRNRFFVVLLIVMLCLNAIAYNLNITYVSTSSSDYFRFYFAEHVSILCREYNKDPELILQTAELVSDKYEKEQELMDQAIKNRTEYDISETPAIYFKDINLYTEDTVFRLFSNRLSYAENYNERLEEVINAAKRYIKNMDGSGLGKNKFVYDQQVKSIEQYKDIARLKIPVVYDDSMYTFFTYGYVNLFLLLSVLFVCSEIFAVDNGMMAVMIRTSKKGRMPTFVSKICAAVVLNIFLTFIFYIETLLCAFQRFGIPDLTVPLQSIPLFELCPYPLTILGGIVVVFALKCLIILTFSAFVLAFSVLRNQIITYISGFLFIAVNYLLSVYEYVDSLNPLKIYNLYSIANPYQLINRYSLLNVFGNAVPALTVVCVIAAVIFISAIAVSTVLYRNNTVVSLRLPRLKLKTFKMFRPRPLKIRSLISWESYKLFIDKKLVFLVIPVAIIAILFSSVNYRATGSPGELKYLEIMESLEGPVTDEKIAWINDSIDQLNKTVNSRTELKYEYEAGIITSEEYFEKLRLSNIAETDLEVMMAVNNQAMYLLSLGDDGVFLYDMGWKILLLRPDNIFYFVCIVLLFAGIFADEFSSGFAPLLHTTVNGRKKVTFRKLIITAVSSSVLFTVLEVCDFFVLRTNYGFPQMSAPLACLTDFAGTNTAITLLGAYIIYILTMVILSVALAMAVTALSYFTKNKTATITLSVLLCVGLYLI